MIIEENTYCQQEALTLTFKDEKNNSSLVIYADGTLVINSDSEKFPCPKSISSPLVMSECEI